MESDPGDSARSGLVPQSHLYRPGLLYSAMVESLQVGKKLSLGRAEPETGCSKAQWKQFSGNLPVRPRGPGSPSVDPVTSHGGSVYREGCGRLVILQNPKL